LCLLSKRCIFKIMSVSDRREREKEALKNKILNAAAEIVTEDGHNNLKIRDLAERIEYSPRTVYLYYPDKAALLEAVIEKGFERTVRQIEEADPEGSAQSEQLLIQMMENHVKTAFFNPNYYRAVVSLAMDKNFKTGFYQDAVNNKVRRLLCLYLGSSDKQEWEIDLIAATVMNSLRGFSLNLINNDEKMDQMKIDRSLRIFIKFVFEGLRSNK